MGEYIIQYIIPIAASVIPLFVFFCGCLIAYGAWKQKQKYDDEKRADHAIRIQNLESGERFVEQKRECEEERAQEIFKIITEIKRVEKNSTDSIGKLERSSNDNFTIIFEKLDDITFFMGQIDEFKNHNGKNNPGQ